MTTNMFLNALERVDMIYLLKVLYIIIAYNQDVIERETMI